MHYQDIFLGESNETDLMLKLLARFL